MEFPGGRGVRDRGNVLRLDRSHVEGSGSSRLGIQGGIEIAALYGSKSRSAQCPDQSVFVPRIQMLPVLTEMIVDVVKLRFAPFWMDA